MNDNNRYELRDLEDKDPIKQLVRFFNLIFSVTSICTKFTYIIKHYSVRTSTSVMCCDSVACFSPRHHFVAFCLLKGENNIREDVTCVFIYFEIEGKCISNIRALLHR